MRQAAGGDGGDLERRKTLQGDRLRPFGCRQSKTLWRFISFGCHTDNERGIEVFHVTLYTTNRHLIHYFPVESLQVLLRPKILRGSASSPTSSRWRISVRVLDLTDHNPSIIRGLRNRITTTRKAAVPSSSGAGLNVKASTSRPPRTLFPCNDCRTSGHQLTTKLASQSRNTSTVSMPGMCLGKHQVLALGRCWATPSCPGNIHSTKTRQGYRWISMPFLLGGRSVDCPSQAMTSWAMTFLHCWGVCSGLKMNSFLHITKKMVKCYGKCMIRLALNSVRDEIENIYLVFLGVCPPNMELSAIIYPRRCVLYSCPITVFPFRYLKVSQLLSVP